MGVVGYIAVNIYLCRLQFRDERRVIYGLYDVARRTRQLRVPRLVWLERIRYLVRDP